MHWGVALAASITDLFLGLFCFFSASRCGWEMSLRRARCLPHFFVSHDYYFVRFTSV